MVYAPKANVPERTPCKYMVHIHERPSITMASNLERLLFFASATMKDAPVFIRTFSDEQYQQKLPAKISKSKSVYIGYH